MSTQATKEFYENKGFYLWTDKSFNQDRVQKLTVLLSILLDKKIPLKILDIGSGTGDFISALSNKYPHHKYYANDIASNIIKKNKEDKPQIIWSLEDHNSRTSYKTNFFDVIIAGEILEHLHDTDTFISELYRILKPGGTLLLTTPNLASWLDRITLLLGMQPFSTEVSNESRTYGRRAFYKLLNLSDTSDSAGHLRCFTRGSLKDVFEAKGFKDLDLKPCHVHNFLLNSLFTRFFPTLSQNTILIAHK